MKLAPKLSALSLVAALSILFLSLTSASALAEPRVDEGDYVNDDYDDLRVLLSLGADYSQGDYGVDGPKTKSGSAMVAAKVELEPLTLRLSVPYLINEGCSLPEEACANTLTTGTDKGLGDVVAGLTYTLYPDNKALPLVDFTTKVKIPTATDKDLGTGATDVTLQIELLHNIGDLYVFGGGGYRFKGSQKFKDIMVASAGGGWRISKGVTIGVAYEFREASTTAGHASHEISPNLIVKLGEHVRLGPYGVIGLSNGAPDWGVGSTISYEF